MALAQKFSGCLIPLTLVLLINLCGLWSEIGARATWTESDKVRDLVCLFFSLCLKAKLFQECKSTAKMNIDCEIGRKEGGNKVKTTCGILKLATVIYVHCSLWAFGWPLVRGTLPHLHWDALWRGAQSPDLRLCP